MTLLLSTDTATDSMGRKFNGNIDMIALQNTPVLLSSRRICLDYIHQSPKHGMVSKGTKNANQGSRKVLAQ